MQSASYTNLSLSHPENEHEHKCSAFTCYGVWSQGNNELNAMTLTHLCTHPQKPAHMHCTQITVSSTLSCVTTHTQDTFTLEVKPALSPCEGSVDL